ncbi:Nramp family divalent metal transporter [Candidatus Hodarchaeum mangrovi]
MPIDREFQDERDIPEPFKIKNWKDYFKFLIGPGIIALGLGLGTGELVSTPFLIVGYGPLLLWVALVSIILQTSTAITASKYTILTGEPFQIGLNRLGNKKAWTVVWIILGTISALFPYYPALLGLTFVALTINTVPIFPDNQTLYIIMTFIALAITIIPLLLGKKVIRTLGMMFFIIHFCIIIPLFAILTLLIVPFDIIIEVFLGFFAVGTLPSDANFLALGAVAGFAGLAASAGMSISMYYRDTGWGMAKLLGHIPGAIGGEKSQFQVKGFKPKVDATNMKKAKIWFKYIKIELIGLFFFGSIITMLFPVALNYYLVDSSAATENTFGFTAVLANNLANYIPFGWLLILLMLAAVFFADGSGVIDGIMRQFANILWNAFPSLNKRFKGDVRPVYYGILSFFIIIWILMVIFGPAPVEMVLYAGSLANIGGVIFAFGLIFVHFYILPREYRFSILEIIIVLISIVFYGFFLIAAFLF